MHFNVYFKYSRNRGDLKHFSTKQEPPNRLIFNETLYFLQKVSDILSVLIYCCAIDLDRTFFNRLGQSFRKVVLMPFSEIFDQFRHFKILLWSCHWVLLCFPPHIHQMGTPSQL